MLKDREKGGEREKRNRGKEKEAFLVKVDHGFRLEWTFKEEHPTSTFSSSLPTSLTILVLFQYFHALRYKSQKEGIHKSTFRWSFCYYEYSPLHLRPRRDLLRGASRGLGHGPSVLALNALNIQLIAAQLESLVARDTCDSVLLIVTNSFV